jgi:hypothetical protein
MDAQELTGLAEQLLLVGASLIEDLHPRLVETNNFSSGVRENARALAITAEQLSTLAACSLVLLDISAGEVSTA